MYSSIPQWYYLSLGGLGSEGVASSTRPPVFEQDVILVQEPSISTMKAPQKEVARTARKSSRRNPGLLSRIFLKQAAL